MSCEECERIQETTGISCYYRWKNANVELRGCSKHIGQIIDTLNDRTTDKITDRKKE